MAVRVNGRSIRVARAVRALLHGGSRTAAPLGASLVGTLRSLTTAERALPLAVAAIVAVASLLAVLPNTPQGAVGGTQGSGTPVRIAIGGGTDPAEADVQGDGGAALVGDDPSFRPVTIPENVTTEPGSVTEQADAAAMLDDGTLLTGYAPSTTVEDGADLIQTYKVRSGDTLVTIAHHFGVSMMTLWWANKLPSKDALHIGQVLRIPPVNGLVVTVKATDTLDSLAAEYKVDADRIVELNGLEDPTLVVGQVLVLPGARGEPIPTPKPTPKPVVKTHVSSGSSGGVHYTGGRMRWPVIGGNNYISQYYHYGHWALDIAAQYGSKVVAAAAGRVTFAGWKSNGGGYQVWISHGGGIYTTYNHMSAITVGIGQSVGRGQQVGRIGQSGDATGPHLHFEVWRGPIWNGGTRVNPLPYLR
jgi:murein DD-endopeptidase MepM/ murein hydrolase activator NlpD